MPEGCCWFGRLQKRLRRKCIFKTLKVYHFLKNHTSQFKENSPDENLRSPHYTLHMCENLQTDLVFETTKLQIFANNINLKAKYATTYHSCGGSIESARGSLASPYYPSTYPANIECIWSLQGTKGSFLELQFNQFDIVKSEHCNEDYLEIRKWSEGQIIGIFCGSKVPQERLVSFERVWLKFHSAEGNIGKGFKLSWNYGKRFNKTYSLANKFKNKISSPFERVNKQNKRLHIQPPGANGAK